MKFINDLEGTHKHVIIESPFITTRRINRLLPTLQELRRRGVTVIINTRDPIEHDEPYRTQALVSIMAMQTLDIQVLYTTGHHRKLAIIDNKILWEGSLNILSQNDSCEIMRRTISRRLARQMKQFIGANRWP